MSADNGNDRQKPGAQDGGWQQPDSATPALAGWSDSNERVKPVFPLCGRVIGKWTDDGRKIARPLKLTFSALLGLTIFIFLTSGFMHEFADTGEKLDRTGHSVAEWIQHQKKTEVSGLERALIGISEIGPLRDAFVRKDREELLALAGPIFAELNQRHHVTHFYFTDRNRVNFLRAHKPEHYGDLINRETTLKAEATGAIASGLELGTLGNFTLRVVEPWYNDKTLIGYIELGTEISHIIRSAEISNAVTLIEAYDKTLIDPKMWRNAPDVQPAQDNAGTAEEPLASEGAGALPRGPQSSWSLSNKYLLSATRIKDIPPGLGAYLDNDSEDETAPRESRFLWSGSSVHYISSLPLTDARAKQVGHLIVSMDVTPDIVSFVRSQILSVSFVILLGGIARLVFGRIAMVTEYSVLNMQERLESEVDARTSDLAESEQRLKEAQNIASFGNWERDLATGSLFWSDEVFRIFGVSPDGCAPDFDSLLAWIHPEDLPDFMEARRRAVEDSKAADVKYRIVRPSGEIRHVQQLGRVTFGADGKPMRITGTIRDITARKRAEGLSQRFARILESSLNEIYIFNADSCRFIHVNDGARRNLGYTMPEMGLLTAWDIKPEIDETGFRDLISPLRSGETRVIQFETVHRRKDGTTYPVEVHLEFYAEEEPPLFVAIINDISERRKRDEELRSAKKEAERLAYFDDLTGLPNRAGCKKDTADIFANAGPDDGFAVIHIDLDNFKRINDTSGHAAGDALLREVGGRLRSVCSRFGQAYRWGGDEFVLIAEQTESSRLSEVCDELTALLSGPLSYNNSTIRPTASLGVARYPEDGSDFDSLMVYADLALYRSKNSGRDTYHFFTRDMKAEIDNEVRIERELHGAIERKELFLVYQPQVDLRNGKVTGIEALIRWNHPQKGVISPGGFMGVVEATGLAPVVGKFVIDTALAAARSWEDAGVEFGKIAVNLSPRHLRLGSLFTDFTEAMKTHRIAPEMIAAEVLESLFLDDPHGKEIEVLRRLHELGIHIELDDFGTGYASLSHLSELPIDGLKIDRSFTNQMLLDETKAVVVKALIDLARMLKIGMVCEGVETPDQMAKLLHMGNCSVQGYYISRPMPFEQTTSWLTARGQETGVEKEFLKARLHGL